MTQSKYQQQNARQKCNTRNVRRDIKKSSKILDVLRKDKT